jgi:hypothetical protein
MGRRTEIKTEPRSEGEAERAFRAQQTQPFSSTTVLSAFPRLFSSRLVPRVGSPVCRTHNASSRYGPWRRSTMGPVIR